MMAFLSAIFHGILIFFIIIILLVFLLIRHLIVSVKEQAYLKKEQEKEEAYLKEEQELEQREYDRIHTVCRFDDGLTKEEFDEIVYSVLKDIKRITYYDIKGPVITCIVLAQSGISEWEFTLDFNYYGHITGWYKIISDNYDSNIPEAVAERISRKIQAHHN